MFRPSFQISSLIEKATREIEGCRRTVEYLPLDVKLIASLRETARLRSTHYSTQIEGNRLGPQEVEEVIKGAKIPGRERDESEVKNYYAALAEIERLSISPTAIAEKDLQIIHKIVMSGKKKPSNYRDGQNVIRDSQTGAIVYLPPEAKDVPLLMAELVKWVNSRIADNRLSTPLIAGVAHYQYVMIHPYYDGNGRTARLFVNLILYKTGFGLKGLYSLEEYYARDLARYYAALTVGPSHNYYSGRANADLTSFLEYFCLGMAESFLTVKNRAEQARDRSAVDASASLRMLDPKQRRVLELFTKQGTATTSELAAYLQLSPRTVTALCRKWTAEGFLLLQNPSRKARAYRLGNTFEEFVR